MIKTVFLYIVLTCSSLLSALILNDFIYLIVAGTATTVICGLLYDEIICSIEKIISKIVKYVDAITISIKKGSCSNRNHKQ
jgi:hypothetical protein